MGENWTVVTILLKAFLAAWAGPTGINHNPNCGSVVLLELLDGITDLYRPTGHFMTGNAGVRNS
jgi:hypothetical protein